MVNMNAADDKEHITKSNNINGVYGEVVACSSTMCTESDTVSSRNKLIGNLSQNIDCNKHPITNGAYPKTNSISNSGCENGGPSDPGKTNTIQVSFGKSENIRSEILYGESEKGLLLKNNFDFHPENTELQSKPKDRSGCDYDRNSSSEDEECCIYTYKGDSNQMADLPSSFFRMDLMPSRPNEISRNSSPDMDYLEMDFDPGPSNDRYSSSDSECNDRIREDEERFTMESSLLPKPQPECESSGPVVEPDLNLPTPLSPLSTPSPVLCPKPQFSQEQLAPSGLSWSPPSPQRQPTAQEDSSDALQPSYCYCVANKLSPISSLDENFNDGNTGTMIWKEHEAGEKQVTQIGTSLCGATAVINVLLALNVQFTVGAVKEFVNTRMRSETALVPEYLISRCNAGATHVDMIRGLQGASQDLVYARFFPMYPQRSISLTNWLSHWIRKGAVPIATLNLQQGIPHGTEMPDFWHHQMIYGVGAQGVYLTNPLEVQSEARLWPQLASPSVLKVRREDVLSRWTADTSLLPLIDRSLLIWRKLNVLGQVVNVIRESSTSQPTQHITIPASYSSGVTLAVLRTSPAYDELRFAPELPIDPFASS